MEEELSEYSAPKSPKQQINRKPKTTTEIVRQLEGPPKTKNKPVFDPTIMKDNPKSNPLNLPAIVTAPGKSLHEAAVEAGHNTQKADIEEIAKKLNKNVNEINDTDLNRHRLKQMQIPKQIPKESPKVPPKVQKSYIEQFPSLKPQIEEAAKFHNIKPEEVQGHHVTKHQAYMQGVEIGRNKGYTPLSEQEIEQQILSNRGEQYKHRDPVGFEHEKATRLAKQQGIAEGLKEFTPKVKQTPTISSTSSVIPSPQITQTPIPPILSNKHNYTKVPPNKLHSLLMGLGETVSRTGKNMAFENFARENLRFAKALQGTIGYGIPVAGIGGLGYLGYRGYKHLNEDY